MQQESNSSLAEPAFQTGAALVIGGSGGIGAAICLSLAQAGANVALTYFSKKSAADSIARRIEAIGRDALILNVDYWARVINSDSMVVFIWCKPPCHIFVNASVVLTSP